MNGPDFPRGDKRLARIRYDHGEYHLLSPGTYVVCAVTGAEISLEDLRYWNVDLQEAYASPEIAVKRYEELRKRAS